MFTPIETVFILSKREGKDKSEFALETGFISIFIQYWSQYLLSQESRSVENQPALPSLSHDALSMVRGSGMSGLIASWEMFP